MQTISAASEYQRLAKQAVGAGRLSEASQYYLKEAEARTQEYKKCREHENKKFLAQRIQRCVELSRFYSPKQLKEQKVQQINRTEQQVDVKKATSDITFDQVAGMHGLKNMLEEYIIWPLTEPDEFDAIINNQTVGLVLYGPPGCGKTHLAKAAAGEVSRRSKKTTAFYEARISDIKSKFVGESEQNLRAYFEAAAANEPSILFFDELDALGSSRGSSSEHSDELVDEFLQDFQIVDGRLVLVIGATNFPQNLDYALVRSGRLGQQVLVEPPDLEARLQLFDLYTKKAREKNMISSDLPFEQLASLTKNYACSDIAAVCDDAVPIAKRACKKGRSEKKVNYEDFLDALSRRKSSVMKWKDKSKKDLIDMNIYKYNKEVQLKSGIPEEYMDLVRLIFKIEDKELVQENGVWKVSN